MTKRRTITKRRPSVAKTNAAFECPECGATFSDLWTRQRHRSKIHGIEAAGYSYADRVNLQVVLDQETAVGRLNRAAQQAESRRVKEYRAAWQGEVAGAQRAQLRLAGRPDILARFQTVVERTR